MNIDKLNSVPPQPVGNAAFACLTKLQKHRPEAIVVGVGYLMLVLADHYDVDPREFLRVANNLAYDGERLRPEFRAIREYAKGELPK